MLQGKCRYEGIFDEFLKKIVVVLLKKVKYSKIVEGIAIKVVFLLLQTVQRVK